MVNKGKTMKHYEQWRTELEAMGFTVSAEGEVTDHMGNACAGEDRFGQAWCKDPRINELTAKGVPAPKVVKTKAQSTKKTEG
jgi:hypothetical protein